MSRAIITVDLAYGDSGKGTIVDALVRKYRSGLVIRFNGGSQCGHNVVTDDGTHHEFAQFGSGTFNGAKTLLSKHVLVNPLDMMLEAEALTKKTGHNPLPNMYVDDRTLVTTPYHVALNRIRELSRTQRHGSCGRGIRETVVYADRNPFSAIRVQDLQNLHTLKYKLSNMQLKTLCDAQQYDVDYDEAFEVFQQDINSLARQLAEAGAMFNILTRHQTKKLILDEPNIIFEAAQGVLLDQHHGFRPHITKSTCTMENAQEVLQEVGFEGQVFELGICRTYMTKHGAGPFPTEDEELTKQRPDVHNHYNDWQQNFRVGYLDLAALKYAVEVNGKIDGLAVTHLDVTRPDGIAEVATSYQRNDASTFRLSKQDGSREQQEKLTREMFRVQCNNIYVKDERVPSLLASALNAPVVLTSHGPTSRDKRFYGELNTNCWS